MKRNVKEAVAVKSDFCLHSRVGYVSCSGGRRVQALKTAPCGRTCAPSDGSWPYRRPTETRSTRRSRGSSTTNGSTRSCTSRSRRYEQFCADHPCLRVVLAKSWCDLTTCSSQPPSPLSCLCPISH